MDMISYALGQKAGERNAQKDVEIVSDMTFTDKNNDGNITVDTVEGSGD